MMEDNRLYRWMSLKRRRWIGCPAKEWDALQGALLDIGLEGRYRMWHELNCPYAAYLTAAEMDARDRARGHPVTDIRTRLAKEWLEANASRTKREVTRRWTNT